MKKYLLSLLIGVSLVGCSSQEETVSFEYTVSNVDGGAYTGSASDGTGIWFTDEYIQEGIEVGDKVIAVFEADNTEDGLIEVIKK